MILEHILFEVKRDIVPYLNYQFPGKALCDEVFGLKELACKDLYLNAGMQQLSRNLLVFGILPWSPIPHLKAVYSETVTPTTVTFLTCQDGYMNCSMGPISRTVFASASFETTPCHLLYLDERCDDFVRVPKVFPKHVIGDVPRDIRCDGTWLSISHINDNVFSG